MSVAMCRACRGTWCARAMLPALLDPSGRRITAVDGWANVVPGSLSCPSCALDMQLVRTLGIETCPMCKGVWLPDGEIARLRDRMMKPDRGAPSKPASLKPPVEAPAPHVPAGEDRFSFDGLLFHALVFPVALAIALLLTWGRLWFALGYLFQATYHEWGHATAAWLAGYFAFPMPFGITTVFGHSMFVTIVMAAACGGIGWFAWSRRLFELLAVVIGFSLLLIYLTATDKSETDKWITWAGCAGELVLPTIAIVSFSWRLPDRLRWDFWRFPVLLVGMCVLVASAKLWVRADRDASWLPRGSALFGNSDSNGDVDKMLRRYRWTESELSGSYVRLASVCGVLISLHYLTHLGLAWRRRRAADEEPGGNA